MKILISAYACEPGRGSEPEAGLQVVLAAASRHMVWVITRENNVSTLLDYLSRHPHGSRVEVVGFDLGDASRWLKRRLGRIGLNLYYVAWQSRVRVVARQLNERHRFDVIHHATFAGLSKPVGVYLPRRPFVWGPIGGGVTTPRSLWPFLGVRGTLEDIARIAWRTAFRAVRSSWTNQPVVLVQNRETARFLSATNAVKLPNALSVAAQDWRDSETVTPSRSRRVLVVGQLRPMKGGALALRAFAHVGIEDAIIEFIGVGTDERRLRRLAKRLGISHRVAFLGHLERREVLERLRQASVLAFPSFHDEAPFVVAEALTLGTPVVSLDHGGGRELAGFWTQSPYALIDVTSRSIVETDFAEALVRFLERPALVPKIPILPDVSFSERLLEAYEQAVERFTEPA